jgi:FkbM family methyltransferase
MALNSFHDALVRKLRQSEHNNYRDNWDAASRGPEIKKRRYPALRQLTRPVRRYLRRVRAFYRDTLKPIGRELAWKVVPALRYNAQAKRFDRMKFLYDHLEDAKSKELLVDLCAFREIGHRKVKLERNNPAHWNGIARVEKLEISGPPVPIKSMQIELRRRDLSPLGFHMLAYCTAAGGSIIFIQRQYELHRDGVVCKAETGDVVIEAGACWGETALYFAHEVGEGGRVIAFEFIPSNIEVLRQNIASNPHLAARIQMVDRPLWDRSDQTLYYVDWGPGSRVSFEKMRADFPDTQCKTITIDDVVAEKDLPNVDFIKMDIEGAELNALKGAEQTIRRFHPKLAISLYHRLSDFETIPRYIDSLGLSYKYYLDHHTIYENETVLFALPQRG